MSSAAAKVAARPNPWADPEMRAKLLAGMKRAKEARARGEIQPKPAKVTRTSAATADIHTRGMGIRGTLKAGRPGDHRCTPRAIWLAARHAAGIEQWDLDPATNQFSTLPAATKWDGEAEDRDGLALAWFGDTWCNPPFSGMGVWTDKAIRESARTRSLTFLGPGDSSTEWWRKWVSKCDAWAAWPTRIHFPMPDHPTGSPPGPIHLFYVGPRATRWRRVMAHVGCTTFAGGSGV
jgi:hypothetical protein